MNIFKESKFYENCLTVISNKTRNAATILNRERNNKILTYKYRSAFLAIAMIQNFMTISEGVWP